MTERVKKLLALLKSETYKAQRRSVEICLSEEEEAFLPHLRSAAALRATLACETPVFWDGDRIGFYHYNTVKFPQTLSGWCWKMDNTAPDYAGALSRGMDDIRAEIAERLRTCTEETREFYEAALMAVDAVLAYADRYAEAARKAGNETLAHCLRQVPHRPATTLYEACVFVKFIIYTLRCNQNNHVTLGRFDAYMRPYYEADLRRGKTRDEALELIEELFLSLNFDTDLYEGIQKGDNGQSLVLGGCGSFDDFSHLCMEASLELNLIDPKINLRVDKNTPDELYEFATLMTKQGMGFPQYCNDDVVIPGLVKLGYAPEDAADYAVAACWEFIIPGKGADVPNLKTMNFPAVIEHAVREHLETSPDFESFLQKVRDCIAVRCEHMREDANNFSRLISPYFSVLIQGCLQSGKDATQGGAIYTNYGCHGAGIATAADALMAIREVVFEKKEVSAAQLIEALDADFEGFNELRNRLLSCATMGNGDASVDTLAYRLMDAFAENMNGKPNWLGGVWRAGTGSAAEYWYSAQHVGATADGRHAHEPYGCSYSPSLEARVAGPLSCIRSFAGYDLTNIINGGPLTLELHDTVFRNEEGIRKVAQLVKTFVHLGGHQLQLNCVNRETLLEALEHPEDHKNLIVRVWGWSGYFNELDRPFQEHVIRRTEFMV